MVSCSLSVRAQYPPTSLTFLTELGSPSSSCSPFNPASYVDSSSLSPQSVRPSLPTQHLVRSVWSFRHISISQPGNLSGASDAISLLSPIPQFLRSLHILPTGPATCLPPVLPSLLVFQVFLQASNVKFSPLKS